MGLHRRGSLRSLLVVLMVVAGAMTLVTPQAVAGETVPTTTSLQVEGGGLYGDDLVLTATVTSESGTPTGAVQASAGQADRAVR